MSTNKGEILSEEKECLLTLRLASEASHKKKPEILLNLNQRGQIFADTPTPTRFIRNCEEVGLFEELQNVNPFEETFRKAVESVRSGEQPRLELLCPPLPDDTLHTPNVFPLMPEHHVNEKPAESCQKAVTVEVTQPSLKPPRKYRRRKGKAQEKSTRKGVEPATVPSAEQNLVVVNSHVTFKLPIPILPLAPRVYKPNYFSTFEKNAVVFPSKKKITSNTSKRWNVPATGAQSKIDHEKSELMERNRIAACKTREKKKHYVAHLETMKKILLEKSTDLEQRVHSLLKENSMLKERLSKCHCSKSMKIASKDFAQQTEDMPCCNQDCAGDHLMTEEVVTSEVDRLRSTDTTELEKEVFYATLPETRLGCGAFEVVNEPIAPYSLRKPFKKRNLN